MTGGAADTPFNAATTESPPRPVSYPLLRPREGEMVPSGDAILMYFAFSTLLALLPSLATTPILRLGTGETRDEGVKSCFAVANGLDATRRLGPVFDTVPRLSTDVPALLVAGMARGGGGGGVGGLLKELSDEIFTPNLFSLVKDHFFKLFKCRKYINIELFKYLSI